MKSILASKLRKQLKARKLGSYTTNAIKRLSTKEIVRYLWLLSIKEGSLVNDCDGFNHRIKEVYWTNCWPSYYKRYPCLSAQFRREDDFLTCGCPNGPEHSWSVAQIMEYYKSYSSYLDPQNLSEREYARFMAVKEGEPIVDKRGILLPAFRNVTTTVT